MDIILIGSGNVATVLGRKFNAAGHRIVQVVSRNASAASALAYEWDTESTNYLSLINPTAEVYLIAVSDEAIGMIAAGLNLPRKVVVAHTAASVSKDILKNITPHYGVFYPLQSLRKELNTLPPAPVFFDGNDETSRLKLSALANSISPRQVIAAGDDQRMQMHVAAVIAGNFINHLYVLVENYCKKQGLDFDLLLPLIEETSNRLRIISPSQVQTGPAKRGDWQTIEKHLAILDHHPALKKIYALITESIMNEGNQ